MQTALKHLVDAIQAATHDQRPLRLRGGGSKDFLGQSLVGDVLDTRACAGIVSYEPTELVVTARAGTPLAELEALLATQGQCLPFEPPHLGDPAHHTNTATGESVARTATVGGMVAAGLNGPSRASVGAVRDFVLGVQAVNGRGEVLTFGGQVMKNVAGYDVSRLFAGSMGVLGLVAEVSLKVLPVAPAEATLCFEMGQAQALAALNRWGGQPLPLNASCWVQDQGRPLLYVRLRGAVAAVEAACQHMGGARKSNATVAADWAACGEQRLPFFVQAPAGASLWRVSLPQAAPALSLGGQPPDAQLVEWHGAQRWVWAGADQAPAIRAAAQAAGGHATLFKPAAQADRQHGVFTPLAAPLANIHHRLKAEFDPAGIFGPGRLYPGV